MEIEILLIQNGNTFTSEHINQTAKTLEDCSLQNLLSHWITGSLEHTPACNNLQNKQEKGDGGRAPPPL